MTFSLEFKLCLGRKSNIIRSQSEIQPALADLGSVTWRKPQAPSLRCPPPSLSSHHSWLWPGALSEAWSSPSSPQPLYSNCEKLPRRWAATDGSEGALISGEAQGPSRCMASTLHHVGDNQDPKTLTTVKHRTWSPSPHRRPLAI